MKLKKCQGMAWKGHFVTFTVRSLDHFLRLRTAIDAVPALKIGAVMGTVRLATVFPE